MKDLIKKDVVERFLRYTAIESTSYSSVEAFPSSKGQMEMGALLAGELKELGTSDVEHDRYGYVYAFIPGNGNGVMTLCAHMDTSEAESGRNIRPVVHENYDGSVIALPEAGLVLDPEYVSGLARYTGSDIITSSGDTLLGADDKAGLAEIMTLLHVLKKYPELPHPPLSIVFTPEEETGRGSDYLDHKRLGDYGYTLDIGEEGELNDECFDAWKVTVEMTGVNMHPGYAYKKMGNASAALVKLLSMLPRSEAPDKTRGWKGFYHLSSMKGDEVKASAEILVRDFEEEENIRRIDNIEECIKKVMPEYPNVSVCKKAVHQYRNMKRVLEGHPVVSIAEKAIEAACMSVVKRPIRGGTDGAMITELGIPMPNIFNGGMQAHSKTEWIAVSVMVKAVETLVNLCRLHS